MINLRIANIEEKSSHILNNFFSLPSFIFTFWISEAEDQKVLYPLFIATHAFRYPTLLQRSESRDVLAHLFVLGFIHFCQ